MGKVKEFFSFDNNYHGVLNHDGTVKVAKTEIIQPILHINRDKQGNVINVLVKGRKKSYVAKIHKGMKGFMHFVDEEDCAFIKFQRGQAWMVGFQKKKSYESIQDEYIDETGSVDWQSFLEGVDVE